MRIHAALAAILFALNYYLCRELFRRDFIDQLGSIEAAYIGLARYISQHWGNLDWFPLWYGGIPFTDAYPPLLHLTSGLAITALGLSPGLAYHAVCGAFFCLGPVALYWLVQRLTGQVRAAFFAALFYSVLSPSAMLIRAVYGDLGQMVTGRRLQALVAWGEGPHVTGLTLLPVALVLLHIAMEKKKPMFDLAAAVAMAAVAMTNWLASFTLAIGVVCLLAANFSLWSGLRVAGISVVAYCLASPWIPPSTIYTVQTNARFIGGDYTPVYAALPLRLLMAGAALILLKLLFRKLQMKAALQFAILFTSILALVTLASEWFQVTLLPQPQRYHLQMEMGIAILFGMAIHALLDRMPRTVAIGVAAMLIVGCVPLVRQTRRVARDTHLRAIDMTATPMYKVAHWLEENKFPGRVYVPGAKTFWLNVFTDTPQFDGGFAQGLSNPFARTAWYAINLVRSQEELLLWARAMGIHAITLTGANGIDPYKPLNYPEKLNGLPVLWKDGDEALVRIPHRTTSIARVIPKPAVIEQEPKSAEELKEYVAALEDSSLPLAHVEKRRPGEMVIRAEVRPGQVISLQMSYDRGWKADGGVLRRDGLGQMILDPAASSTTLRFAPVETLIAQVARALALFTMLGIAFQNRPMLK